MYKLQVKQVKKIDSSVSLCEIHKTTMIGKFISNMGWMKIANPVKVGDTLACGSKIKHYKREIVLVKPLDGELEGDSDCNHKHFSQCVYTGK